MRYQQLIISCLPAFLYQLMLHQAAATPSKQPKKGETGETYGILIESTDFHSFRGEQSHVCLFTVWYCLLECPLMIVVIP